MEHVLYYWDDTILSFVYFICIMNFILSSLVSYLYVQEQRKKQHEQEREQVREKKKKKKKNIFMPDVQ